MVSAVSPSPHTDPRRARRGGLHTPRPPLVFDALLAAAAASDRAAWLQWQQILLDAHRKSATALSIEPDASCWRLHRRSSAGLQELRLEGDEPAAMLGVLTDAIDKADATAYLSILLDDAWYVVSLASLNTAHGAAWHMELHPDHHLPATLESFGMGVATRQTLRQMLESRYGWLLVSSPEPLGRSALLQAMMQSVSSPERRLLSIQNPVHHRLPRTTQLVLSDQIAGNPAPCVPGEHVPTRHEQLQAALRMAHDIVVIDHMAADIATSDLALPASSQTLVVQGCTAGSMDEARRWLQVQGFNTAWIDHTLIGLLRHRRVRRLCQTCRHPAPASDEWLQWLNEARENGGLLIDQWLGAIDRDRFSVAPGCSGCHERGFVGTIDVFDMAPCGSDQRSRSHTDRRRDCYRQLLERAVQGEITLADAAAVCRAWYPG